MPAPSTREAPLTVGRLFLRIHNAVARELRGHPWVTGEVRRVSVRNGHCYFELVDPSGGRDDRDAVLHAVCWSRRWRDLERELARCGAELADGLVVVVRGEVSLWDAGGRLRLVVTELDTTALLGTLARSRAEARERLRAEGLLDANRRLPGALVPLRIGLVASAGSEGQRDLLGVLERSGYAFSVRFADSRVQGRTAPAQLAAAIAGVDPASCDVVVVVRGGGASTDLLAFDDERVARAIAGSPLPVLVGIGHTGDRPLADEVAHRSLPTPTACGQALVDAVSTYEAGVAARIGTIATGADRRLREADAAVRQRRVHLHQVVRSALELAAQRLTQRGREATRSARRSLEDAGRVRRGQARDAHRAGRTALVEARRSVAGRAARVVAGSRRDLDRAAADLDGRRARLAPARLGALLELRRRDLRHGVRVLRRRPERLLDAHARELAARAASLAALDPARQLGRGFAIVRDEHGRLLRSVRSVSPRDAVHVRLSDGTLDASVDAVHGGTTATTPEEATP